jgi:hypothetical protein
LIPLCAALPLKFFARISAQTQPLIWYWTVQIHNNKISLKQSRLLIWDQTVEIENCVTQFLI